jgi:hypothetical protein
MRLMADIEQWRMLDGVELAIDEMSMIRMRLLLRQEMDYHLLL